VSDRRTCARRRAPTRRWRWPVALAACLGLLAATSGSALGQAHPPTPITDPDGSPVPTTAGVDDTTATTGSAEAAPDADGVEEPAGAEDPATAWPEPAPSDLDELGLLLAARRGSSPAVKPPDFFEGATADTTKPSGPPYKTGPADGSPVVTPPPALPPGDGTIYAVGDSVLLGTERYLPTTVAGWDLRLDGRVGRRFPEGITVLQSNRASLGQVAVILLGHNDGRADWTAHVDTVMKEMRNVQRVVFVTVTEWTQDQVQANKAFHEAEKRYKNVVVAPWAETVAANPDFLRDNVHPTTAGAIALSNLIAVMIGPVPARSGQVPPRPVILTIPSTPGSGATTTTTTPRSSSTVAPTTTRPPATTPTTRPPATTAPPASTTTSRPATTSTTTAPSTSTTGAAPTPDP
jgi:hypothetical protein